MNTYEPVHSQQNIEPPVNESPAPQLPTPPHDPSGLMARSAQDPKMHIRHLDAGPERVITVIAAAIAATVSDEEAWDRPEDRSVYPAMVVRERPASEIGKPDNESRWTIVGIYRHAQALEGCTIEYVQPGTRLVRLSGQPATVVIRTSGAVRTFEHADDQTRRENEFYRGC